MIHAKYTLTMVLIVIRATEFITVLCVIVSIFGIEYTAWEKVRINESVCVIVVVAVDVSVIVHYMTEIDSLKHWDR